MVCGILIVHQVPDYHVDGDVPTRLAQMYTPEDEL
jgi:hypothetical protein